MSSATKRTLPLVALLVALVFCSSSAAVISAGHNVPTKRLEAAYKVALFLRVDSKAGCYPKPRRIVRAIEKKTPLRATVGAGFNSVRRPGVVYVLRRGTTCGRVRMALRYKGALYVLDSILGSVRKIGRHRPSAGRFRPVRGMALKTKTFPVRRHDDAERLAVLCPGRTLPLGGGMISSKPPGVGGEGVYPHSYEALGAQRGWHISVILVDKTPGDTTPRHVTLQVICGRGLIPARPSPRRTVYTKPGQTKTAIARCPKGQYLFSGGFQRTNFGRTGGNFVTESRAKGPRAWLVTGHAFGAFGGELTAIAYCVGSKRPLLTEVSASTPFGADDSAAVTTPRCPPGRRLTVGGFSANGSQNAFLGDGYFTSDGKWSATGFGYFGPAASLTAYGYCLRVKR